MNEAPELPGGDVPDTGTAGVELGDTKLEPLPGGDVEAAGDRLRLNPRTVPLLVQELVRTGLAVSLVLLLGLVIVLGFSKVETSAWKSTKELLDVVVPALIALLGSAMGFYFGSRG